jgi:hypothetical protein
MGIEDLERKYKLINNCNNINMKYLEKINIINFSNFKKIIYEKI